MVRNRGAAVVAVALPADGADAAGVRGGAEAAGRYGALQ
jgi:hypothetical protein